MRWVGFLQRVPPLCCVWLLTWVLCRASMVALSCYSGFTVGDQASPQAVLGPPFRSMCIACALAAALALSARVCSFDKLQATWRW